MVRQLVGIVQYFQLGKGTTKGSRREEFFQKRYSKTRSQITPTHLEEAFINYERKRNTMSESKGAPQSYLTGYDFLLSPGRVPLSQRSVNIWPAERRGREKFARDVRVMNSEIHS